MALLLIVAASLIAGTWSQQSEIPPTSESVLTPVPILRQINHVGKDGSYTYGYETADGSFKAEYKDALGNVNGKYGYVDVNGQLKVVSYTVNRNEGFKIVSDMLLHMSDKSDISTHIDSVSPQDEVILSDIPPSEVVSPNDLFKDGNLEPPSTPSLSSQSLPNVILPVGSPVVHNKITVDSDLRPPESSKLLPQINVPEETATTQSHDSEIRPAGTFSLSNPQDVNTFFRDRLKFKNSNVNSNQNIDSTFVPHPKGQAHISSLDTNKLPSFKSMTDPDGTNKILHFPTLPKETNPPEETVSGNSVDTAIPDTTQSIFIQKDAASNLHSANQLPQNQLKLILVPQQQLNQLANQPQTNQRFPLIGFIVPNSAQSQNAALQFLQNHNPSFLPSSSPQINQQQIRYFNPNIFNQQFVPQNFESQRIQNQKPGFVNPAAINQILPPKLFPQQQPQQLNFNLRPPQFNQQHHLLRPSQPNQFNPQQNIITPPASELKQAGHVVVVPRDSNAALHKITKIV